VLHCFQKKTQKTSQRDIDLASRRLGDLVKERSDAKKTTKRQSKGTRA